MSDVDLSVYASNYTGFCLSIISHVRNLLSFITVVFFIWHTLRWSPSLKHSKLIKVDLGAKVEWVCYVLQALNSVDLVRYQELCVVHKAALSAQPALIQNEKKLLVKINILCLIEIIFSRPVEGRTISLSIIAECTKLSVEDAELLLMKSLSAGDTLIQLYLNLVTEFETKIKLLKLAHFAVIVTRQYAEKETAIGYLEGIIEKLYKDADCCLQT